MIQSNICAATQHEKPPDTWLDSTFPCPRVCERRRRWCDQPLTKGSLAASKSGAPV